MKSKPLTSVATIGAIIFAALVSSVALALDTAALDKHVQATLDKFYALSGRNRDLVQNAAAVLVFPDIGKGGIGIGGEHGDGGLLQNGKTVGYYSISGGSTGWTRGYSHHSEVILFKTPDARDAFLKAGDWALGADYSYAVMKMGGGGNYDTQSLSKPINVFVFRERGLMDDTSLQGAKISKIAN